MIPKIIHYTWFSGEAFPEKIQNCIDSWHKVMPYFEFVCWDAEKIKELDSCWLRECLAERKWVQKIEEFKQNKSLIKEDVESTVSNAFKNSNLGKRFLILWMVPNDMISFKHKLGFIVSLLKNH